MKIAQLKHRKVCLVLGGHGFIGSHLTDRLLDSGWTVKSFDKPQVIPVAGKPKNVEGLTYIEGDFTNSKSLDAALEGVDVCYHLISTTLPGSSNLAPEYDVETNVVGTIRLLDAAVRRKVKKVVFASSGGTVYGHPSYSPIPEHHSTEPICSYGIAKLAIEKYIVLYHKLYGIDYSILRLANPYGERQRTEFSQGAIAVFLGRALRNEAIDIWGDGSVIRDYLHISDVIQALIIGGQTNTGSILCNIGSGQGSSLNDIVNIIGKVAKKNIKINYLPARDFDVPVNVLDITRAKSTLGWHPKISLETGIGQTFNWMIQSI